MKKTKLFLALILVLILGAQSALGCTIIMVGNEATTDGSTISTHNDDSSSADFRLWIIPSMKGGEGVMRDIVIDSHNYGDYGQFPEVKDYGNGYAVAQIEQPKDTYAYLHSRYSFINEKGVAMGEATGGMCPDVVYDGTEILDCWNLQDLALEQCATATEAVEFMGALVEKYGFKDAEETINISDGTDCWVFEVYGGRMWAAVRIPDNAMHVAANRATINYIDFEDTENYKYNPEIKSFAIENGLWSEESGEEFSPARVYNANTRPYSQLREWRAFDLVAPSLELDPYDTAQGAYPLYVIPERKLSVQDVFEIKGDYYQGTEFDVSLTPLAGDFGDPLNEFHANRTINLFRTCYVMISNVKAWLPDEVKCLVWYGYGAPDSTYLTPLWPSMTELPCYYDHGSRYEDMDLTSGWWINSWVQQTARINYDYAIEVIHERRDTFMPQQYEDVAKLQEEAAKLIEEGKRDEAIAMITEYGCTRATENFETWIDLGFELNGDLMWGSKVNMKTVRYSDWWNGILASGAAANKPVA